jgi:Zn-dependent protease
LDTLQDLIISFVVINLIPLPPLSTGLLLDSLSPRWADFLRKHSLLNELALLALLFLGVVPMLLKPMDEWLRTIVIFG